MSFSTHYAQKGLTAQWLPSSFSRSRNRVINMDIYSYEPCGLPTGNFMPAEKAQIRLMTASPITLRACIPAPDQVTPERAYFKDLDFYKKTLFHTPFLSRGRAVTLLEYRDVKIVFEVDDWFSQLPQGVQRYLLPLQSMYAKWYSENVRDLTQNYSYCPLCKTKQTNLQRHHMKHHARWRTIWFCPLPGCPSSLSSKDGLVKHLMSNPHARGIELTLGCKIAKQIANQNWTSELSKPPPPPERAPPKTIRWDYDYIRDEPPTVQRVTEEPQQHSTPRADPRTPSIRPRPALELPRPRASSAPRRPIQQSV